MTLQKQILELEESIAQINQCIAEDEDFDSSIPINNQNEALEIIEKLQLENKRLIEDNNFLSEKQIKWPNLKKLIYKKQSYNEITNE